MTDLFKNFIQQNRQAFDAQKPGAHGWNSIDKILDRLPDADAFEQYLLVNRVLMDAEPVAETVWTSIDAHLDKCRQTSELEQFICENRQALDTQVPDLRIWTEITGALPEKRTKIVRLQWRRQLVRIAAAIALLLTGLTAGIWYGKQYHDSGMALAEVSPEYAEIEKYYKFDIQDKKSKLASYSVSQSADVLEDIDQLDRIMEELQRELANTTEGNRQQVVRAMIENYKTKAAILERVLLHLNQDSYRGSNSKLKNEITNM